uniref:Uncharacterized protein n=1 Tax=Astyanax mexicanus TaxID=7994 RepID=A0A8B9RD69_ASTMX
MEDEEEDLPVVSQLGKPTEDRGTYNRATVNDNMPVVQTVPRYRATGSGPDASPSCGTTGPLNRPLHSTVGLGLVSMMMMMMMVMARIIMNGLNMHTGLLFFPEDFPAMSEPNLPAAREEEQEEEVEDGGRPDRKEEDAQEGMSVEVQIGRKLREIGDQFQQEHLEMVRKDYLTFSKLIVIACNNIFKC